MQEVTDAWMRGRSAALSIFNLLAGNFFGRLLIGGALLVAVAIVVALLAGASDSSHIEMAHRGVRDNIRDSSSAQFRNDFVRHHVMKLEGDTEPMTVVCGEVNSTNGFGGFTGFMRYYYVIEYEAVRSMLKPGIQMQVEPSGSFETLWQWWCVGQGSGTVASP